MRLLGTPNTTLICYALIHFVDPVPYFGLQIKVSSQDQSVLEQEADYKVFKYLLRVMAFPPLKAVRDTPPSLDQFAFHPVSPTTTVLRVATHLKIKL